MHDQLVDRINKDPIMSTEYKIRFPDSPIKDSERIIQIKNLYELKSEGRKMCHCVGGYVERAQKGDSYFYKVLEPERGTLQITIRGKNFSITQFKLKSNAKPSEVSWKMVKQWLSEVKL